MEYTFKTTYVPSAFIAPNKNERYPTKKKNDKEENFLFFCCVLAENAFVKG